jgi:hypothetical protein
MTADIATLPQQPFNPVRANMTCPIADKRVQGKGRGEGAGVIMGGYCKCCK